MSIGAQAAGAQRVLDPVCFAVGGHEIRWYGLMVALGFLVATVHWTLLGVRRGKRLDYGVDFGFLVMVTGMLGGRLGYVIAHPGRFLEQPGRILRFDEGGLVFYGGLILAILAVVVWARRKGEHPLDVLDFAMTGLPLGHAFGRVGCFINGCCYGAPAGVGWATEAAGVLRHPIQLYEVLFNVGFYVVLNAGYSRRPRPGTLLALYLMVYPAWRIASAGWRGDKQALWMGWQVAQWMSLALIAAGVAVWALRPRRPDSPETPRG
jgi:phosphatidylglycerol:prolipoprotein diacylglycerol transferase